ncbi:hypothetical protein [Agrobacterium burrii]
MIHPQKRGRTTVTALSTCVVKGFDAIEFDTLELTRSHGYLKQRMHLPLKLLAEQREKLGAARCSEEGRRAGRSNEAGVSFAIVEECYWRGLITERSISP